MSPTKKERTELKKAEKERRKKLRSEYDYIRYKESLFDDSHLWGGGKEFLPDGRDFQFSAWSEDGYSFVSYILPLVGLESSTKSEILEYLRSQGIQISPDKALEEKIQCLKDGKTVNITVLCGSPSADN